MLVSPGAGSFAQSLRSMPCNEKPVIAKLAIREFAGAAASRAAVTAGDSPSIAATVTTESPVRGAKQVEWFKADGIARHPIANARFADLHGN